MTGSSLVYSGFWRRLGAHFLDILILAPVSIVSIFGTSYSKNFYIISLLPTLLFAIWYSIILVAKYGGTPGKLIMGIRIVNLDGSAIGYKTAFIRESIQFFLSYLGAVGIAIAAMNVADANYYGLGFQERTIAIMKNAPSWYNVAHWVTVIWVWSEFLIMLTNDRRRSIHDFIAGTVVVRKSIEVEQNPQ